MKKRSHACSYGIVSFIGCSNSAPKLLLTIIILLVGAEMRSENVCHCKVASLPMSFATDSQQLRVSRQIPDEFEYRGHEDEEDFYDAPQEIPEEPPMLRATFRTHPKITLSSAILGALFGCSMFFIAFIIIIRSAKLP